MALSLLTLMLGGSLGGSSQTCKYDADCAPTSWCMNDPTKTPPYTCHGGTVVVKHYTIDKNHCGELYVPQAEFDTWWASDGNWKFPTATAGKCQPPYTTIDSTTADKAHPEISYVKRGIAASNVSPSITPTALPTVTHSASPSITPTAAIMSGNECNPSKQCNVCQACCKAYIPDGANCDSCVKARCLTAPPTALLTTAPTTPTTNSPTTSSPTTNSPTTSSPTTSSPTTTPPVQLKKLNISSCTTSNQFQGYDCEFCFNGLFSPQSGLCNAGSDHWLVEDPFLTFTLGGDAQYVSKISITNRQNYFCCEDSLAPETQVYVDAALCQTLQSGLAAGTIIVNCLAPLLGRTIKILAPGKARYINLVEVEVFTEIAPGDGDTWYEV